MGFLLIKGKFYILGYQPDGDSVKFKPDNKNLFKKLKTDTGKVGKVKVNNKGMAQLRVEAIDALETHYIAGKLLHQPWTQAASARLHLLNFLGFTGIQFGESEKKVTGVNQDGLKGYILTKYVDNYRYGRPVSFVFPGSAAKPDGSDVFLDDKLLKNSLNYEMLLSGFAYPTFYKNLYADLRSEFTRAVKKAKQANRGIYADDVTTSGFQFKNIKSITDDEVILPKLFRRLAEHINKEGGKISSFKKFLETKNDELFVMGKFHRQNLNNLVEVKKKKVRLIEKPEDIIFYPK
jgi:endonuclease YncB( thermonuclease family)